MDDCTTSNSIRSSRCCSHTGCYQWIAISCCKFKKKDRVDFIEIPVEKIIEKPVDRIVEVEKIIEKPVDRIVEVEKIIEIPSETDPALLKEIDRLTSLLKEKETELSFRTKNDYIRQQVEAVADDSKLFNERGSASFGTTWPSKPARGDLFLKIDSKPNKLFSWNGRKWIEIDRQNVQDSVLVYDTTYIDWLIDQVRRGHKEYSDLSDIEKKQIMARISHNG